MCFHASTYIQLNIKIELQNKTKFKFNIINLTIENQLWKRMKTKFFSTSEFSVLLLFGNCMNANN